MMHGPSPTAEELKQQVELLERQLRDAQRLTALGELLGTTTHEFNNVLMSIINYARLGLRQSDEAARTRSLEKILAASQRAARITKTVLGAARNRSEAPEPTDLAALADDVLVLLERELRKYRVAVETEFQPAPPAMVVGNQIQQVLINLLVNARQAMPEGGRVIVRVRHDAASDTVDLTVRDTGTGIPPEQLPRIFDRYFTTKPGPDATGKGGTGLGLAACREIIEAHHGRIRVESSVGKGTAFTLKLPAARTSAPAPVESSAAALTGSPMPAS